MEAIAFVRKYSEYIETIRKVTNEEYNPALKRLEEIDPHDLVKPDSWFADETSALGYVYWLFLKEVRKETIIEGLQE